MSYIARDATRTPAFHTKPYTEHDTGNKAYVACQHAGTDSASGLCSVLTELTKYMTLNAIFFV